MNHNHHIHRTSNASTVASSVSSIIFSVIASSHHWLHMGVLFLLGSSTNMMVAMSGVLWIRRAMVVATLLTTIYTIYRQVKHKHMPNWIKVMNALSVLVSLGFILYTLIKFGW